LVGLDSQQCGNSRSSTDIESGRDSNVVLFGLIVDADFECAHFYSLHQIFLLVNIEDQYKWCMMQLRREGLPMMPEQNMLFRSAVKGSALDEFSYSSWSSFLRFALARDEFRAEFEAETGTHVPDNIEQPPSPSQAAGLDLGREQYVRAFAKWVTPKYFSDDLSPSIIEVLERT
jgi:hypothetical protein